MRTDFKPIKIHPAVPQDELFARAREARTKDEAAELFAGLVIMRMHTTGELLTEAEHGVMTLLTSQVRDFEKKDAIKRHFDNRTYAGQRQRITAGLISISDLQP